MNMMVWMNYRGKTCGIRCIIVGELWRGACRGVGHILCCKRRSSGNDEMILKSET